MTLRVAFLGWAGRRVASLRGVTASVLAVAMTHGVASAQVGQGLTARLIGKVVDGAGIPIARAEVSVMPTMALRVTTNDSGAFHIDSLPIGQVQFAVRRMGFESATFTADLKPGHTQRVTMPLNQLAATLPDVYIKDTALAHPWMETFNRRKSTANSGYFFGRNDITQFNTRVVSDLLRRVPGVRTSGSNMGTVVLFERGSTNTKRGTTSACQPQLFVHQMNYIGSVDDFPIDDIEAVEVYVGISQVPAELQTAKAQTCGAIVLWTREPPPAQKKIPGGGDGG